MVIWGRDQKEGTLMCPLMLLIPMSSSQDKWNWGLFNMNAKTMFPFISPQEIDKL